VDSFELNKMIGAVLFAGLVVLAINEISNVINPEPHETARGYNVPGVEVAEHGAEAEAPAQVPFAQLLAQGSAEDGAKTFRKCATCHTIDAGGGNRVGPNLHNIVGAHFAHAGDFSYSPAIADHGGNWGYDELNHWLANPREFVPGNKMAFGGIRDDQDRANVILYLRENTENPPPLPAPPAAEEPAEEMPAEAPAEDAMPEEGAPEQAAPAEGAAEEPTAEAPAEEAPAEDAPAEEAPAEEAPADEGAAG